jgi:hypothetical protein
MLDSLKSLYNRFYNWWWPVPSDDDLANIVKSIAGPGSAETEAQITARERGPQQVCVVSFANGEHDRCFPSIHRQTDCEMMAARINQASGRTDAVGNLLDGPCPPGSWAIRPKP